MLSIEEIERLRAEYCEVFNFMLEMYHSDMLASFVNEVQELAANWEQR